MQFPSDLEQPAFEMDRFVNLRELCATVTTEVAGAVDSLTIRFAKMVARIRKEASFRKDRGCPA